MTAGELPAQLDLDPGLLRPPRPTSTAAPATGHDELEDDEIARQLHVPDVGSR